MKPRIVILASGSGTTAEAFIRASASGHIAPEVGLVICNNKKAGIFERIKNLNSELGLNIPATLINSKTHPDSTETPAGLQSQAEETAIAEAIRHGNFDLVALMGYMKKIGPVLVHEFGWRFEYTDPRQAKMVNTHPGLLPETKSLYGIHVQEYVLQKKLPFSGQTLHIVAEDYDDGPTIAEHKVAVEPHDTPETLFARVQEAEKRHLPADIATFIESRRTFNQKETT